MPDPNDCRYSDSHEWYHVDGDVVTIGITQYAADALADVTFVEMMPPGSTINAGDPVGEVDSVKTIAEIFTAFGGQIVEVNDLVTRDPSLLNADPFGDGWLVRIRAADTSGFQSLIDAATYNEKYPVG